MRALILLSMAVLLSSCGSDPLVGTWTMSGASGGVSGSGAYTFTSDKKLAIHSVSVFAANNAFLAGCTTTSDLSGTWQEGTSGSSKTLKMTVTSGTSRTEGCADVANDKGSQTLDSDAFSQFSSLVFDYVLNGNVLTLTYNVGTTSNTVTLTRK